MSEVGLHLSGWGTQRDFHLGLLRSDPFHHSEAIISSNDLYNLKKLLAVKWQDNVSFYIKKKKYIYIILQTHQPIDFGVTDLQHVFPNEI